MNEPNPAGAPPTTPPAGFVAQDEVNRIAAEQKSRGERAAREAFEQSLRDKVGDATLDDVIAAYQAQRDADDARKTDAEKALEAANAAKADAERDRQAAAELLHTTKVTAALTAAGAPPAAHAALNVPVPVGATDEDITAAVAKLKTDLPALFTTTPVPPSDPGPGPKTHPGAAPAGAGGLSEYERRYGKKAS